MPKKYRATSKTEGQTQNSKDSSAFVSLAHKVYISKTRSVVNITWYFVQHFISSFNYSSMCSISLQTTQQTSKEIEF